MTTPFIFYATNSLGCVTFLTIEIEEFKIMKDGVVIYGDVVYDGERMKGNVKVNFTKDMVQYTERKTRYRYNLEIDNRCAQKWNDLLMELKALFE